MSNTIFNLYRSNVLFGGGVPERNTKCDWEGHNSKAIGVYKRAIYEKATCNSGEAHKTGMKTD